MLLDSLLCSFRPRSSRSRGRRPRRSFVPNLVVLEDRTVPSTLMVTNNSDTGVLGDGSLRGEIKAASSGDTIVFAPKVYGKSITLTKGELPLATSLSIVGPGADKITISGNDASRIFDITNAAKVTLSGLTITHGRYDTTALGGGILTYGGGGILNEVGATLTLVNDTLSGNQAVGHQTLGVNGQDEFGGALFNLGSAIISGCNFTHNQALGGGDAISNIGGSAGGAIDNYDGATLTVTDSRFSNNSVVSVDGAGYFALGGAIESNAGTGEHGDNTPSTATLTDCTFLDSLCQSGALGISNGGAIMSEGNGTRMTLTNCLISGNRSVGGAGGSINAGIGGGVMNLAIMTIADCAITNNQAVGGLNGDLTKDSRAGAAVGGGIDNNGSLSIANSIISGNIAQGAATATGPGGYARGGAIESNSGAALTVTDSLISDNSAIAGPGGAGGALHTSAAAGYAFGGGIETSANSATTLVGCTIAHNVAQGSVGTNGNPGGDGIGGGLGVGGTFLRGPFSDNSQMTIIDCTIVGNQAVGGVGGLGANGGNGWGGGLAITGTATATLIISSVKHNDALGGEEGRHGGSDGSGVGGGVYVFSGGTFNVDITDVIKKNFASTSNDDIGP